MDQKNDDPVLQEPPKKRPRVRDGRKSDVVSFSKTLPFFQNDARTEFGAFFSGGGLVDEDPPDMFLLDAGGKSPAEG